jgi:phosphoenolpyruvate carboxylase
MSLKRPKEGVCVGAARSSSRKIPSTSATQFPDNTCRPFWSLKEQNSTSDDFFDCYVAFKEFGCHEYFWDWKGRKIDELVVTKLMSIYKAFFRQSLLGQDCFLTMRIAEGSAVEDMGRLYMSIMSANDFAAAQHMFSPPLFEVAHSSAASDALLRFAKLYNESVSIATDKLRHDCGPKTISIIPNHDFGSKNWYSMLNSYVGSFQNSFRCRLDYIRPVLPRSSVADSFGFVGSVLATKRALSSYAAFSKITGVSSYPIVEAAPLLFRGGLSPASVKGFIATYPGARTVMLTQSFRYDYELEEVKGAVAALNKSLPRNLPDAYSREDIELLVRLERIFARHYSAAVKRLPSLERLPKEMARVNKQVEPKLHLSFSLYSLGIPPELVGTGNAILECIREGIIKDLERFYPNLKQDLIASGALLNRENLKFLSETGPGWKSVAEDVRLVDEYTDSVLGPVSTEDFLHRNHTSNVFHLSASKRNFANDLVAAAKLRHCLG